MSRRRARGHLGLVFLFGAWSISAAADDALPGTACPEGSDEAGPRTIRFQGQILDSRLPTQPVRAIPVDFDAHFVLEVEVDADSTEGCIPGGLAARTNFLIHSPALRFGLSLGREPFGSAQETFAFQVTAIPYGEERWGHDLEVRDVGPAVVGLVTCEGGSCLLYSSLELAPHTRLITLDGEGGADLVEVGDAVQGSEETKARTQAHRIRINGAANRFTYRAESHQPEPLDLAVALRMWGRAVDPPRHSVSWDWDDPAELLERRNMPQSTRFTVRAANGSEVLWRGDYDAAPPSLRTPP